MIGANRIGLADKLGRLQEMDANELGHRLREGVQRTLERAANRLGVDPADEERFLARLPPTGDDTGGERSALRYLRETAAPRFYLPAGAAGRRELAERVSRCHPEAVPALAAEAERLHAHRFELLGHGEVACGPEIDWHRDPLTGRTWERRFWADYDLVHDHPAGDPKRVHELARHQHLPRLGKAYLLLGEERHAREAVAQMLGWIDQDPPGVGIHWHSSLEIALRAVSWLWTLFFVLPAEALDEAAARRIGASLFAQLDHVHRYPSVVSSPNTHLLGEAWALFLAGRVFGDCAGAGEWLERGAGILAEEADRQVLPDGVHAELATGYHAYALDFYLQALVLARRAGHELPPRVAERTEAMADFVLHVTRPDGTLPSLGDDDGGRALALAATSYRRPADLLAVAAVLFGRGDLKHQAGAFREEALWLLGCDGWRDFRALPAVPPEACRASFPAAGYVVQRTGWRPRDSHLVFDCGGLGELGGGHGHADALAVTLFGCGRELVADPGTFVYNGDPAWRDAFRSSRVHSTVVVDGRDQSEPGDTFRWRSRAATHLLEDEVTFDDLDYVAAEHHGYAAAPVGVVHRRRILQVRPAYWLVLDDFRRPDRGVGAAGDNAREHDFEVVYQLAPEAEVEEGADPGLHSARLEARAGSAALSLFLHATAPLGVEMVRGDRLPPRGWVSRRYGERQPAPAVIARFRAPLPAAVVSVLAPRDARPGRLVRPWRARRLPVLLEGHAGAPALAVELAGHDGRDVAILSPGSPELALDWTGERAGEGADGGATRARGELFWVRFAPGAGPDGVGPLRRLLAVRGASFHHGGRTVFTSADAVTHYRAPGRGARGPETQGRSPGVGSPGGAAEEGTPCAV